MTGFFKLFGKTEQLAVYIILVPSGNSKPAKYVPPRTDAIFSSSSWVKVCLFIFWLKLEGVVPTSLASSAWEIPLNAHAIVIFCVILIPYTVYRKKWITSSIC